MKKTWPTLYKRSSTGKVQQWDIDATYSNGVGTYTMRYGQQGGKIQDVSTQITEGKNIGRANETSVWEQTVADAESKWNKQKDRKGYSLTITTQKELRPMLAKSYDKDGKHIEFPCYGQPKLDGIRCLARCVGDKIYLTSRQGKAFNSLGHIEEQLKNVMGKDEIWDGELYVHGEEFQDIISAVKRDKPSDKSALIEYHIYDKVDTSSSFEERYRDLLVNKVSKQKNLNLVHTFIINSPDDIVDFHSQYTAMKYEGIMLRNKNGAYKIDGRSADLQKVKTFFDEEFEIVDAEENVKGKSIDECTLICITKEGTRFGVKPKGDTEVRKQYWTDWKKGKLKGKMLTVRYFSLTSSEKPVPRFPIGIAVREDYE